MKLNSAAYYSKIKTLTEQVKGYHPLVRRVPNPLPKVGSPSNLVSQKLSAKDVTTRKEEWGKRDDKRLDKAAISYWLTESVDEPRRVRT